MFVPGLLRLVQEFEVTLSSSVDNARVIERFEAHCVLLGLTVRRLELKKYPGCAHWHLTKSGEKGTLEATYWPEQKRLWFSIHDNRGADWHGETIKLIKAHWL